MAGAGNKLFTSGSVLTASDVNTYLMDQTIMRFTSTTTRDAAFGGAGEATLAEGMFAYTTDTNTLWLYDGSNWVNVLGSDIGAQALSNRNVIINGAMQVAQRGTSTAGITGNGYYTADRYALNFGSLGTFTQSVEADAPTGSGLRNSVKMLCTTADASPAASDILTFRQTLEGQNVQQFLKGTSSAKPFSASFWVKSNVTGTYICRLQDLDNSRSVSASYTISVSATWEKKTVTFPADTTGAFTNDNGSSLVLDFGLGAGSDRTSGTLNTTWENQVNANTFVGQTNLAAAINNYWQVTGVQLEVGSVATPFEFEQISDTLTKCQRYYTRYQTGGVNNASFGLGIAASTTLAAINVQLPVTMRIPPTSIDFFSLATLRLTENVNAFTPTAITLGASDTAPQIASVTVTTTGLTQFRNYYLQSNGSSGYVGFSAEL